MSQIRVNSIVPVGGVQTSGAYGGIIQIKPTFTTAQTVAWLTTPIDVNGMSVTITPSSTDSKFLIMASMHLGHSDQSTVILLDLVRNGVKIAQGTDSSYPCTSLCHFGANTSSIFPYSYQHLDETNLADLSDITYKYQIKTSGVGYARVNSRGNADNLHAAGNLIVCEVTGINP